MNDMKFSETKNSLNKLVIKRIFDAPQELVWEALTNKNMAEKWFGPEGLTTKIHEWGIKPGETYSLTMRTLDGVEYFNHGVVKEFEKPSKFSYTWAWDDAEGNPIWETLVSVELRSINNKTEMTFTHSGFENEGQVESHKVGWTSAFNKMERLINKDSQTSMRKITA